MNAVFFIEYVPQKDIACTVVTVPLRQAAHLIKLFVTVNRKR